MNIYDYIQLSTVQFTDQMCLSIKILKQEKEENSLVIMTSTNWIGS